jgi:hypothetical protein
MTDTQSAEPVPEPAVVRGTAPKRWIITIFDVNQKKDLYGRPATMSIKDAVLAYKRLREHDTDSDEDEDVDFPLSILERICVDPGREADGPIWSDKQLYNIFLEGDTTDIVVLQSEADGWEIKTFAFLSAPRLPDPKPSPLPPAKCVLICGRWKTPKGTPGWKLVHNKREEIAKKRGYETLLLTAASRKLVPFWQDKGGFEEIPVTGCEADNIPMTKSLVPTSAPAAAPAAAGQGPPGGRRRKTRKPRKPRRKTRKARK